LPRLADLGLGVACVAAMVVPVALAATSPLLAWRDPVYIAACFAGIVAMALLLVQPLLAVGRMAGLSLATGRHVHRWLGAALVLLVAIHVGGLAITNAPDVLDALTFQSPTAFSPFGVIAMGATVAIALFTAARRRLRLKPRRWRMVHVTLATLLVVGTIAHAVLVEGTMEPLTKAFLALAVISALLFSLALMRRTAGMSR
jgi:predicted ferric reductase